MRHNISDRGPARAGRPLACRELTVLDWLNKNTAAATLGVRAVVAGQVVVQGLQPGGESCRRRRAGAHPGAAAGRSVRTGASGAGCARRIPGRRAGATRG